MNAQFSAQRIPALRTSGLTEQGSEVMQYASAVRRTHISYPDYSGAQRPELLRKQNVRRVPPPKDFQKRLSAQKGLLGRVFAWLRGGMAAEKKLRVIETVPLGEKRMVAIVEAEGQRFLVGCGSNGVSLLTSLKEEQERIQGSDSLAFAGSAE